MHEHHAPASIVGIAKHHIILYIRVSLFGTLSRTCASTGVGYLRRCTTHRKPTTSSCANTPTNPVSILLALALDQPGINGCPKQRRRPEKAAPCDVSLDHRNFQVHLTSCCNLFPQHYLSTRNGCCCKAQNNGILETLQGVNQGN